MTGSRESVLARVRAALRHQTDPDVRRAAPDEALPAPTDCLPRVGPTNDQRLQAFAAHLTALDADLRLVPDDAAMRNELRGIAAAEGWRRVGSHRAPLTSAACDALGLPTCWVDGGYAVDDLERCDAGVTECEALVAQTGSVLVTAGSSGGRALSVLPPHHVVLARSSQLLPDLPAAFALLKERHGEAYPSFISLITGPSRTADIERILVLGAHGPRKLTIVIVES